MKKTIFAKTAAAGLCVSLLVSGMALCASADYTDRFVPNLNQAQTQMQQMLRQRNEMQGPGAQAGQRSGNMIIGEPGEYTLTGDMRGTVMVDPGAGDVKLVLDGARIDGVNGPAITALSGDRLDIELAEGSVNAMFGGAGGQYGAAVYSQVPVSFDGGGRLDLQSQGPDAIQVQGGDLSFNGGDLRIQAGQNGLDAPSLNFNGGSVSIDARQNDFAPGASVNMNGGQVQNDWTPDLSFSRSVTAATQYDDSDSFAPQNDQFGGMPGMNNQQFGQQNDQFGGMPGMDNQQMGQQNNQFGGMPGMNNQQFGQQNTQFGGMPGMNNQQMGQQNTQFGGMPGMNNQQIGQQNTQFGGMPGMNNQQGGAVQSSTSTAGEIVSGITENSAMSLTADYDNATNYNVSETSSVKISDSGTYVVTGTSEDGNITVKKGTTGVVLVLNDLDLTSTSGAALSINKEAEVQVIVSGNVTLTDNENPDDEYSADADVADAYDGAAIKVKAGAVSFITGDGTLNVNGNAKNGIKAGDDSSLIIGGDVTVNINAVNDGINGNYDVTVLSGKVNVKAGDDGIHADHILTVGKDGRGPELTISESNEGLEGTVVNIGGGKLNITSTDDAINAANADGVYEGELGYSVNMTGGELTINSGADGFDSNGNVNLTGGSAAIHSANNGGDAGIDYDGDLYISDSFNLNNGGGVAGPDMMPGGMGGQMGGNMGGMSGQMGGAPSDMGGMSGNMGGGMNGGMGGQMSGGPSDMGGMGGQMGGPGGRR